MQPYLNEIQLKKLNGHLEIILNDFEVFKKDKILSNDESKENQELLSWYRKLGEIRKEEVYTDGKYIEDYIGNGVFSFIRRKNGVKIITIVNNSNQVYKYSVSRGHDLINDICFIKEMSVKPQTATIVKIL